jgi:hypothetical protein
MALLTFLVYLEGSRLILVHHLEWSEMYGAARDGFDQYSECDGLSA